jgi:predicted dehydrogenase
MFSYLFGRVIYIKAYKSTNISPFKNDPNLDVVMRFKNGVLLTMKGCDDSYYLIFEIDILAQKARIVMADELKYFKAAPGKNLLKRKELMEDEKLPFKFTYPRYAMTGLNFGVRHIADCLDKKEKPLSTGEDGLYTLSLIDKILKSAREKREIFNV